jgi:hypothetical protein
MSIFIKKKLLIFLFVCNTGILFLLRFPFSLGSTTELIWFHGLISFNFKLPSRAQHSLMPIGLGPMAVTTNNNKYTFTLLMSSDGNNRMIRLLR